MNPKLENLLTQYSELESAAQELVNEQCCTLCSYCTQVCCRADICEEAIESPFLRLLHQREVLDSDRYGFLCETGCSLPAGRPPVCLEYFCDDQLYHQPDETHAKVLRTLGALVAHAGRNATGETHLVEIMQADQLEELAFQRLQKQFDESFLALELIRRFYNEGTLPDNANRVLDRITFSDEDH
ncbi:hypothetical protein [Tichowtungia aerotolerans]|uniref:Uncharacterized protein n=1 Tax=Tichowtungia aerotolerans TaxID=2697043 RepID=A0A6P1MCD1_9BACT|nr:hypothetical protein [Tichowtungia aerotolerans]QHI69728.1 hypothetical protein GT409_09785 [Tichowtungia aerotolerans]